MATTASVHTNTYGGRTITLTVSEISTSIDNNTSTIQWTLTSGTSSTYHSVYDITAWVGGTASSNKVYGPKTADWSSRAFPCKDGSTSGTLTIQHNADGTASPVPFRLRGSVFNNNPQNYDGSIDLTTIPRASTFTLSKTSGGTATTSFSLGDAIYVNITRASNTFTHKVYFVIGSSGNQVLSNSATTSANTTLAASLAQYIPSASGTATMYVDTYSGSTLIGSKSSTFTISVPANVLPSITSVTKTDTSNLLASYGAYVQGKSSLRVQTAASGNYSSITNYSVKLKNGNTILQTKTGSDVTFSNITYTGTIAVEVTITDSRNRTATNSSNITIAAYNNPSASINAERRNNDDVVTLVFNGTIKNINNANVNSKTFTLEKKKKSDNTWTTLETYTSAYNYSSNSYTTSCDSDYAWDFRLTASDSFTSSTATTDVGTAFELVNYGADGTSIGFGKVAETANTFECNLNTDFKKNIIVEGHTNSLSVEGIQPKNIIGVWFNGWLSTTDGSEVASNNARRTDFIEIDFTKHSNYVFSGLPTSSYRNCAMAYNSNKQFLGRTGDSISSDGTREIDSSAFTSGTPQGTGSVKYIRMTVRDGVTESAIAHIQLEIGSSPTSYSSNNLYGYISGNTPNGNYVKYNDGRLEVWGTKTLTSLAITGTTTSGVFISSWQSGITYAQPFISTPEITQVFVQQV